MKLEITNIAINDINPNKWNPNKQTDRQFAAEIESIKSNGFIMPITVRQIGDTYEIIDGEHRYRALTTMFAQGTGGAGNVDSLLKNYEIPAIILDVDDNTAKKLTVILNETRGRADLGLLANVLSELNNDMELADLIVGMPYSEKELEELISVTEFDWEMLAINANAEGNDESNNIKNIIQAELNDEVADKWRIYLSELIDILPKDRKLAAGIAIGYLLERKSNG